MQAMYKGQVNSPKTILTAAITATSTSITVENAAVLPAAPNLAVLGMSEIAETILYTVKNNNVLSGITRGFQGTARAWGAETVIARNFTAYDNDAFAANIAEVSGVATAATDAADTAQTTADNAVTAAAAAKAAADSHKTRHATGGADAVTPAMIGAATTAAVTAAASAAAAAQTTANGKANPAITTAVTLSASSWANGAYTLSNSNILANSPGSLRIAQAASADQFAAWGALMPQVTGQAAGSITITARGEVPTMNIPVELEVRA